VERLDGRCLPSGNPAVSISDASVTEGDSGQSALVFHVTLSRASSREVSVNFATAGGSAAAGEDFVGRTGKLTFAPGETYKTISVLVNGDPNVERHEQFSINLSGASRATIADATGVGTIHNDDVYPNSYPDPYTGWPLPVQPGDGDPYAADNPYYPNG
jgi:hypothetical protein